MRSIIFMISLLSTGLILFSNNTDLLQYDDPLKNGINKNEINNFIQVINKKEIDLHYLAIVKGNKIVTEYSKNYNTNSLHDIASVTKVFISLLIGELVEDRLIHNVDDDITKYLTEFKNLKGITIKHLLTMSTGLNGHKNIDLFKLMSSSSWTDYIKSLTIESKPGKKFRYNTMTYHILSLLITKVSGMTADKLLEERVLSQLGIKDFEWDKDPQGNPYGWGNLKLRANDILKFAYLIKNSGEINSRQIISKKWLLESLKSYKSTSSNPFFKLEYGYAWFIPKGLYSNFYVSLGRGGQTIYIFPDRDLIIVTLGNYDISSLMLKIASLVEKLETTVTYYDYWNKLDGEWIFEDNYFGLKSITFTKAPQKSININGELLSLNGIFKETGNNLISNNQFNIGSVECWYNYTENGDLILTINEIENINTFNITISKEDLDSTKLKLKVKEHQLLPKGEVFNCKREN